VSYQSRLKREIGLKLPGLANLAEAALNEAKDHGIKSVTVPPPRALDDKTFAAMEEEWRERGAIVSLRLGGDGWSAHIMDPEYGRASAAGYPDPDSAWLAVKARQEIRVRQEEDLRIAGRMLP
jgi:hypothetical protein